MADVRHAPEGQAIMDLGSEDSGSPRSTVVDPRAAGTNGTTSARPTPTQTQAPRAEEPEPKGDTEGTDGNAPRRAAGPRAMKRHCRAMLPRGRLALRAWRRWPKPLSLPARSEHRVLDLRNQRQQ